MRPRDRESAKGLLPRMEARPRKDGLVAYRYHPAQGKPIALGTDKAEACRKVLDLLGVNDDRGTITKLWQQYQATPGWRALAQRTREDYEEYSVPLLQVFGEMRAAEITAPMVARYLRVERGAAPKRANREVSLLGNLIGLALERGEAEANPCRGGLVKRNFEQSRQEAPEKAQIEALATFAQAKGGQWAIITMAAEFASLVGARQAEFLRLYWPQFGADEVRLRRAKQRGGKEKIDSIAASPALVALRERLQMIAKDGRVGVVFPNRQGNPYTASGFAAMWGKLMREAMGKQVIDKRFTFHDLRAYYTGAHMDKLGKLPDIHASPTTTAKVYNRGKISKRDAL